MSDSFPLRVIFYTHPSVTLRKCYEMGVIVALVNYTVRDARLPSPTKCVCARQVSLSDCLLIISCSVIFKTNDSELPALKVKVLGFSYFVKNALYQIG